MWPESGLRGVRSAANSGVFAAIASPNSRFRRSRRSGARIRSRCGHREPARAGKGHAMALAERADRAARADGSANALADDLARADDDSAARAAAAANADDHPGAVETTAATSTATSASPRRERSSVAGLLRREGAAGSAERPEEVSWREPDSDFSSLPIEPPALPDCAKADDGGEGDGQEEGKGNRRDDGIAHEQKSKMKNRISGRSRRHRRNR